MSKTKMLSQSVVERFLQGAALEKFLNDYQNNKHQRGLTEPTDKDFVAVDTVREYKSISKAAKELGISSHRVYSALARVAAHQK